MKTPTIAAIVLGGSIAFIFSIIPPHSAKSQQTPPVNVTIAPSVEVLDTPELNRNIERVNQKVEDLKDKTKVISNNSKQLEQQTKKLQRSVADIPESIAMDSPLVIETVNPSANDYAACNGKACFPAKAKPVKHGFIYRLGNIFKRNK